MKNSLFYIVILLFFSLSGYAVIEKNLENYIFKIAKEQKTEDFQSIIHKLLLTGSIEKTGLDRELRPIFVTIQGIIEKALAISLHDKTISKFVGAIHTPTPATPFCVINDISSLVTEEMLEDPKRLQTIWDREQNLKELLSSGAKIYVVYPKDGLNKRSEKEKEIFLKTCNEYQSLINNPIKFSIEKDLIGATYLFEDNENILYLFSIRATQANDTKDDVNWKIWLGKLSDSEINNRFNEIEKFLNKNAYVSLLGK